MGEVTQYARQAYLGTGPKGLLRATKGSKLPHPYRGITLSVKSPPYVTIAEEFGESEDVPHPLKWRGWNGSHRIPGTIGVNSKIFAPFLPLTL